MRGAGQLRGRRGPRPAAGFGVRSWLRLPPPRGRGLVSPRDALGRSVPSPTHGVPGGCPPGLPGRGGLCPERGSCLGCSSPFRSLRLQLPQLDQEPLALAPRCPPLPRPTEAAGRSDSPPRLGQGPQDPAVPCELLGFSVPGQWRCCTVLMQLLLHRDVSGALRDVSGSSHVQLVTCVEVSLVQYGSERRDGQCPWLCFKGLLKG